MLSPSKERGTDLSKKNERVAGRERNENRYRRQTAEKERRERIKTRNLARRRNRAPTQLQRLVWGISSVLAQLLFRELSYYNALYQINAGNGAQCASHASCTAVKCQPRCITIDRGGRCNYDSLPATRMSEDGTASPRCETESWNRSCTRSSVLIARGMGSGRARTQRRFWGYGSIVVCADTQLYWN